MGLIDRVRSALTPVPVEQRNLWDAWGTQGTWPYVNFNGNTYPLNMFNQSLQGTEEKIARDFVGFGDGTLKGNPVVFACMQARASLFSEARFMYRRIRSGTPGELFSTPDLELLRHPWPGGTTGDLLARTMQDHDIAGNSFWVKRPGRLVRLRPDWVTLVHGSHSDPELDMWDVDAELLGIAYQAGGPAGGKKPEFFQPVEYAHFAPIPDPIAPVRGMSWLTPLIREVQADTQMTTHKQAYLVNGATPNLVVMGVPGDTKEKYTEWVDRFAAGKEGAYNAYKSLYLTPGMDAKVLGNDLAQVDFKHVQGLGETRIAAAAGVPAAVVGISEGLAGSSLNAGNFGAAMRRFADLTMRPAWRNVCGSFEQIVAVPSDAELWYDDRDIPALKDDIKDYAEVQSLEAQAMRTLIDAGFVPDSVVASITSGDKKHLKHSGLFSVQLQAPGAPKMPTGEAPGDLPVGGTGTTAQITKAIPKPGFPPGRDATALLLDMAERRAIAAERRADAPVPAPVINVTTPERPVTVTFERGAFEVPITVEQPAITVEQPDITVNTPDVHVEQPEITAHITLPPPARRTVIDYDDEGNIAGSHEVPVHDD